MELINECSEQIKKSVAAVSWDLKPVIFSFNTSQLTPFTEKGCERENSVWNDLGHKFEKISSPVLYWFKILSNTDPNNIYRKIKQFRDNQVPGSSFRSVPALKPLMQVGNSHILYVGCCGSTTFVSRMFWHFGYYHVGRTQGLQLCHWAQPLAMEIEINAITFPKEAKDLIYVYEKYFAQKLKPIIGKHK